jgi:hypothetical protein
MVKLSERIIVLFGILSFLFFISWLILKYNFQKVENNEDYQNVNHFLLLLF